MWKRNIFFFLLLACAGFIAYRDCFSIFIPADDYGLLHLFKIGIIPGLNKLDQAASPPYFISYPILYVLYEIYGTNPAGWVITAIAFHIINAFLLFLVSEKILQLFLKEQSSLAALLSSALFLISPYQAEPVLWSVSELPKLLTTAFFLLALWKYLFFLETGNRLALLMMNFLFFLAAFSYESSFAFPAVAFILFFLYKGTGKSLYPMKDYFIRVFIPQAGIVFLYLATTRFILGSWLWHSSDNLELDLSFTQTAINVVKYFLKFFLFFRYLPDTFHPWTEMGAFRNTPLGIVLSAAVVFLFLLLMILVLRKTQNNRIKLSIALFSCFLVSLVPVLPLDSSFLRYIYTDRYGYLPSIFFYIFFCTAAFAFLKKLAIPFIAGYIILCWVLLAQTISTWNAVNTYCNKLIEGYAPFLTAEKIYVLDVPAYLYGIAAFRDGLDETMAMRHHSPLLQTRAIAGSYHDHSSDSIQSVRLLDNGIEITGPQRKTPYFSVNSGWAKSYKTDDYRVDFDSSGCSCRLTFKEKIPQGALFIYATENGWKKIN